MDDKLLSRKDKKQLLEFMNNFSKFCRPIFPFVMPVQFSLYLNYPFVCLECTPLGFSLQFMIKRPVLEFVSLTPGRVNGEVVARMSNQFLNKFVEFLNLRSELSYPVDRVNFTLFPSKNLEIGRLSNGNLVVILSQ